MPHDILTEEIVPIAKIKDHIPTRPSRGTVMRWVSRGIRGVTLESVLCGGIRYTSVEAIARFHDRLNSAGTIQRAVNETPSQRKRKLSAAEKELAADGI